MTRRGYPAAGIPAHEALPPRRYATCAADALQCLIDLKDGMRRIRPIVAANEPLTALIKNDVDWLDWCRLIDGVAPFYWTADTAALVTAASVSYPLHLEAARSIDSQVTTPPSYLPRRPSGLCVFSEPCLYIEIDGRREPLSALAWYVSINVMQRDVQLSIRGIAWTTIVAIAIWWSDGGAVEVIDRDVDDTFQDERIAFTKWVCTAAMFIEQEILGIAPAVVDRAVRRRAERAQLNPSCHVVTLRKELQDDRHQDTGNQVEWSHRWLVRGHWRRQFFPSRETHVPVWIHPHVKGPADKPFMEPKPTVYAVTR